MGGLPTQWFFGGITIVLMSVLRLVVLFSFNLSFASAVGAQESDQQAPADGTVVAQEQDVALAVVGEIPSMQPVLATCSIYPENVCVGPTQNYLDDLGAQNLPADEYSESLFRK